MINKITRFISISAILALSVSLHACDKDKKSEDTPAVAPSAKSAAAAKAAASAIKIPDIGGSNLKNLGPQLRSIYRQGQMHKSILKRFDGETPDLSQFDICSILTSSCSTMASSGPIVEEGTSCTTSCPASGGTTMSCTSAEQKNTCDGVEYTMKDFVSTSSTSCSKTSDTVYSFAISVDMSGKVQGGEITESTALTCKFNLAMALDLQNPPTDGESAFDTAQLCNNMVCTLGGEVMSCQDMQNAVKEDSCD